MVCARSDEAPRAGVPLLQQDAAETWMSSQFLRIVAMVPQHVEEPFASVVVVKQRGVEAAGVDVDRVRPRPIDGGGGDDEIVRVLEGAVESLDVGVDQPEQPVGVGEAGRPDAARIGIPAHVELVRAIERPANEAPVHEIARVMDLDAGKPFERRRRDVIVVADATDRGIGVEARKDRVVDHGRRLAAESRVAHAHGSKMNFDVFSGPPRATRASGSFAFPARRIRS